jgi:glutamate/tyrosine decarboxylase-like PLP-dependent enzyme
VFDVDDETQALARRVVAFIDERTRNGGPLGATAPSPAVLEALTRGTVTAAGLGVERAFDTFEQVVLPYCVGLDSPRFLAFIPAAPNPTSIWFDAVVAAGTFSAESWLEGAGAVHAENDALRFLADVAGLPTGAAGCFVSGGSAGNLSALAVARDRGHRPSRRVAVADTAHASVDNALRLLALGALEVPTDAGGRFTGAALEAALDADLDGDDVGIVVASGGSTNGGVVDDLAGIADVCARRGLWLHVDAAYGGAALLVPEMRSRFAGIERADSFIVDPHKWLFGPLDCCALLYREPQRARAVHTQRGPYIEVLHLEDAFNPMDHAYHLTRRARGLPFWFALVAHGTDAFVEAIRHSLRLTAVTVERLAAVPGVEVILEPELSVVLFRREGWDAARWRRWAEDLLAAGTALVAPTTWKGEAVGRVVYLHPRTPDSIVEELAESLR